MHRQQNIKKEKRVIVSYIVHLLDKCSKILQNARHILQDCSDVFSLSAVTCTLKSEHLTRKASVVCGFLEHATPYGVNLDKRIVTLNSQM